MDDMVESDATDDVDTVLCKELKVDLAFACHKFFPRSFTIAGTSSDRVSRSAWNANSENCSCFIRAGTAPHPDLSTMAFDDLLAYGKPEPGSTLFLCGEVGLEDSITILGWNTMPVVANYDVDLTLHLPNAKMKFPSIWQGIEGIHDKIRKHLKNLAIMHLCKEFFRKLLHDVNVL